MPGHTEDHSEPSATSRARWGKLSRSAADQSFLAGPQRRLSDLFRAIAIFFEFLRGFRALHFVGPCVTVFGSARFGEDNHYYRLARELGAKLTEAGFAVMTGGGPGIMEAANRGAMEAGGFTLGCNIKLPVEQQPNRYLHKWIEFKHFFVRKVMLVKYSSAFVALPGGYGTLDEIFETLTLIQTKKISSFPLILMGRDFWAPLIEFIEARLLSNATIAEVDRDLFLVTDSPEEAAQHIREVAIRSFGFQEVTRDKPRWYLFER
ncbi:MAG: TIGR00730 family Rossman fold protein [Oligoflexia bacterium]|nr:TIGR00730 family Rossman fold protein [Oligoflexia bacterium]